MKITTGQKEILGVILATALDVMANRNDRFVKTKLPVGWQDLLSSEESEKKVSDLVDALLDRMAGTPAGTSLDDASSEGEGENIGVIRWWNYGGKLHKLIGMANHCDTQEALFIMEDVESGMNVAIPFHHEKLKADPTQNKDCPGILRGQHE